MITVLVVDDELLARKLIIKIIENANSDFKIIAEAENAHDAFKKYQELKPDIVITDICMDGTDGIDLVKEIYKYDKDCHIIVVSAYDNFEYAKQVYENGVSYYLLKSFESNELIEKLLLLKAKIQERNDNISNISKIRENYFRALLENPLIDDQSFKDNCKIFGIKQFDKFVIAKIYIDSFHNLSDAEKKETSGLLHEAIDYICKMNKYQYIYIPISLSECTVIVFFNKNKEDAKINIQITELFSDVQEQFDIVGTNNKVSVGISGIFTNPQEISDAYAEANSKLYATAWQGKEVVLGNDNIDSIEGRKVFLKTEDLRKICDACLYNRKDAALEIIDDFFKGLKDLSVIDIRALRTIATEVVMNVVRNTIQSDDAVYDFLESNKDEIHKLRFMNDVEAIKQWIISKILLLLEETKKNDEVSYVVRNIIDIIEQDYMNILTTESIAKKMHFSASYIARIFKMKMGVTLHAYITKHRIEKAIMLMQSENAKISEISQAVGYYDTNYFSQIFKKIVGVTPQKYMKDMQKKDE